MSIPTPTPYTVNGFGHGFSVIARMEPHGVAISAATACDRNEIETAAFIVTACNAHAQLVAQNERLREALKDAAHRIRWLMQFTDVDKEPIAQELGKWAALSQPEKQS